MKFATVVASPAMPRAGLPVTVNGKVVGKLTSARPLRVGLWDVVYELTDPEAVAILSRNLAYEGVSVSFAADTSFCGSTM
jgi:hypothetical protein